MRRCGDGTTLPNAIATVVGAAARGLIPRNTVLPPPFRGSGRAVRVATGLTQESTNRASNVCITGAHGHHVVRPKRVGDRYDRNDGAQRLRREKVCRLPRGSWTRSRGSG